MARWYGTANAGSVRDGLSSRYVDVRENYLRNDVVVVRRVLPEALTAVVCLRV